MLAESYTFFVWGCYRQRLFSRAQKTRKSKLLNKAILPKLDEEFETKADELKEILIDKLLKIIDNKNSAGVKDFFEVEVISRNSKFSAERLRDIDYTTIQLTKWTNDSHKNELIRQVILNYLQKYKELDAQTKRKKLNITIGDELPNESFRWLRFILQINAKFASVIRWRVVTETKVLFLALCALKICRF